MKKKITLIRNRKTWLRSGKKFSLCVKIHNICCNKRFTTMLRKKYFFNYKISIIFLCWGSSGTKTIWNLNAPETKFSFPQKIMSRSGTGNMLPKISEGRPKRECFVLASNWDEKIKFNKLLLSTQRYSSRTAGRGQQLRAQKQDNVLNIDS